MPENVAVATHSANDSVTAAGSTPLGGMIVVAGGVLLHHAIVPVMGDAAGTRVPAGLIHVYRPGELVLLALAGVAVAAVGALVPATWAARAHPAAALRAE